MKTILLVLVSYVSLINSLECINCGIFLSAPTSQCRGKTLVTSCAPENIGCLTITGQNQDGTYYVEKRCAHKSEDGPEGCKEISVRNVKSKRCICKADHCNGSHLSQSFITTSVISLSLYIASI